MIRIWTGLAPPEFLPSLQQSHSHCKRSGRIVDANCQASDAEAPTVSGNHVMHDGRVTPSEPQRSLTVSSSFPEVPFVATPRYPVRRTIDNVPTPASDDAFAEAAEDVLEELAIQLVVFGDPGVVV